MGIIPGNLLINLPGLLRQNNYEIINLFITLKWNNLIGQFQAGMVEERYSVLQQSCH